VYVNGDYSVFEMRSGVITGNEAGTGGGVGVDNAATFIMRGGTIKDNRAGISNGGGIYANYLGSTVTIDGGSITNNFASYKGGGVTIDTSAGFIMTRGSITNNSADLGSNVSIISGDLDNIDWNHCTIGDVITGGIANSDGTLKGWNTQTDWSGTYSTTITGDATHPVWSGNGLSNPIAIISRSELAAIGDDGTSLGLIYALASNITLGSTWAAMGNETTPFTGRLDGRRHTITVPSGGTTITPVIIRTTPPPPLKGAGLFGLIDDASAIVENLTLIGGALSANTTTVVSGDNFSVGGIAGLMVSGTIQNCAVKVSISQTVPSGATGNIGGVAGYSVTGIIQNCYSSGGITGSSGSYVYVGGIAGTNGNNIANCYSTGAVSATATTFAAAGGIAGDDGGAVAKCYSTGAVSATASSHYAGGIAGQCTGTISNSVALGPSITTPLGNNLNRICGVSGTLNANYGRSNMLNGSSPGSWTPNTPTDRDGGDVSMGTLSGQANTQAWWQNAGTGPGWTVSNAGGGNPSLPWEWDTDSNLPTLYWE
jgi:hypothetical protein